MLIGKFTEENVDLHCITSSTIEKYQMGNILLFSELVTHSSQESHPSRTNTMTAGQTLNFIYSWCSMCSTLGVNSFLPPVTCRIV